MKKLTLEEFIEKANIVHNNKFDYSKSVYRDSHTKIIIICPIHSEFKQTPNDHLNGHGCPNCNWNAKLTQETFIQKANKIHNYKFDYSKSIYIDNNTELIIICDKLHEFKQTPNDHFRCKGCKICNNRQEITTEDFIRRARLIHGDKYIYDKSIYINNHTKLIITCPKHGDFKQRPANHFNSGGCKKCSMNCEIKTCKNCGFIGDNINFRGFICKKCEKIRKHIDYEKNIDKIKERTKTWALNNKDKVNKMHREYKDKNRDKVRKEGREYYYKNKEKYKINANKPSNKIKKREYKKNRLKNDPVYKLRENISCIIRAMLKRNGSSKRGSSFTKHLPYTIEELKLYIESLFEPWMNWDNWGIYNSETWIDGDESTYTWQLDHIYPQSKLPYSSMEDENFKKCWALDNLRPLSAKQNNIKRDNLE